MNSVEAAFRAAATKEAPAATPPAPAPAKPKAPKKPKAPVAPKVPGGPKAPKKPENKTKKDATGPLRVAPEPTDKLTFFGHIGKIAGSISKYPGRFIADFKVGWNQS